jgi:hypothetical protein
MATAYVLEAIKNANRVGDVKFITSSDFPVKAVPSAKAFGERFPSDSEIRYRLVRRATAKIVRKNYV